MEIRKITVDIGDVLKARESFINEILMLFQKESVIKPIPPIDAISICSAVAAAIVHNNPELNEDMFHQIFHVLMLNKQLFQKPIIIQPANGIIKP